MRKTDGNRYYGAGNPHKVGDSTHAQAIVDVDAAYSYKTFAHEVGHLMGGKHGGGPGHTSDNELSPLYARGYVKEGDRSILAPNHFKRILYHTDPDIYYNGHATGVAESSPGKKDGFDMGRHFVEIAPIVAAYLDYSPALNSSITGPHYGDEGVAYTWCAEVSHCSGSFTTYLWEQSIDGFAYSNISGGTTSCINYTIPAKADLYLRLTISCTGSGESIKRYLKIYNQDWEDCDPCLMPPPRAKDQGPELTMNNNDQDFLINEMATAINIFPNPADRTVTVQYVSNLRGVIVASVVDMNGRTVYTTKQNCEIGHNEFAVDVGSYSQGEYTCILQSEDKSFISKRIIVNHD